MYWYVCEFDCSIYIYIRVYLCFLYITRKLVLMASFLDEMSALLKLFTVGFLLKMETSIRNMNLALYNNVK